MEEKYLRAFLITALALWLGVSLLFIVWGLYLVLFYHGIYRTFIYCLAFLPVLAGVLAFVRILFVRDEKKCDIKEHVDTEK